MQMIGSTIFVLVLVEFIWSIKRICRKYLSENRKAGIL